MDKLSSADRHPLAPQSPLNLKCQLHDTFSVNVIVSSLTAHDARTRIMSDLHPNFFLSKRFPAHAAIELRDLRTLQGLLSDQMDANFYFERKLPRTEISVLHQACCTRVSLEKDKVILDMVKLCILKGAEVNSVDCVGQTPLFYAVTNPRAGDLIRLLLDAGLSFSTALLWCV